MMIPIKNDKKQGGVVSALTIPVPLLTFFLLSTFHTIKTWVLCPFPKISEVIQGWREGKGRKENLSVIILHFYLQRPNESSGL